MEQNENTEQLLKDLFAKAGKEDLVITVDEVESNLTSHTTNAMSEKVLSQFKYWLLGGCCILLSIGVYVFTRTHDNKVNSTVQGHAAVVRSADAQAMKTAVAENEVKQQAITTDLSDVHPSENRATRPDAISTKKESAPPSSYYFKGDAKVNFEFDHKKIHMVIGESVKELNVDGVRIDADNYSKFEAIIAKGISLRKANEKDDETAAGADAQKALNRKIMDGLVKQLQDDHLVNDGTLFDFRLTGAQVLLNGKSLEESVFLRYKATYERLAGFALKQSANVHIRN
jgi:hypothetical protein